MIAPRFYFTAHPGDLMRTRLLPGASILVVASAFWDSDRGRFKIRRPPADHIGSLAIDSGGYMPSDSAPQSLDNLSVQ